MEKTIDELHDELGNCHLHLAELFQEVKTCKKERRRILNDLYKLEKNYATNSKQSLRSNNVDTTGNLFDSGSTPIFEQQKVR